MSDDDWNIGIGIRNALVYLVIWSVVLGAVWTAAVYFVAPVINTIGPGRLLIPAAALGMGIGWVLVRGLTEVAGFSGFIPMILAFAFAVALVLGGVIVVDLVRPLPTGTGFYVGGPAAIGACVVIFLLVLRD
jgi:hypothetical protein